jgi:Uma2 family endonuclease
MAIAREHVLDERELYPVHEEENVPVRPAHEYQVWTLLSALRTRLPQFWVTGDICMYWEEGAIRRFVAPDVVVLERPIEGEDPGVYLAWKDARPLLTIEIGSKSTFKEDEGPKVERYIGDLQVGEYLYYKPHRMRRWRNLVMWRLDGDDVVAVEPNAAARLSSRELGLDFGLDEKNFLRLYEPDGSPVPLPQELQGELERERQRADTLEQELDRLRRQLREREAREGR